MCGVSVENSDDFRRNIDAFRTKVDFFRTNVDAFHRTFMHAIHTNVDAFRRYLKLMRAHSLVTMVTSVAILCKMAACKQCTRDEFALPNCNFCPNGGNKTTSKIVQSIVVFDKCLV